MFKPAFTSLALVLAPLAACATTGTSLSSGDSAQRTGIHLDLSSSSSEVASAAFPEALDTRVRAVDRMAHSIKARFGATTMTATLDLCVAPDGHVTKVELADASTFDEFDHALLRDATAWQFASLPGPASVQSCRRALVEYRAR